MFGYCHNIDMLLLLVQWAAGGRCRTADQTQPKHRPVPQHQSAAAAGQPGHCQEQSPPQPAAAHGVCTPGRFP